MRRTVRGILAFAILLVASCTSRSGSTNPSDVNKSSEIPVVVVTYSVLGAIVSQLVGDSATVEVLIPDGQDPHEFQPSAKDIEKMNNANIVIANGLQFEEGLNHAINSLVNSGVPVFIAGDHVTTRILRTSKDPHIWVSVAKMLEMLPALTEAIGAAIKVDLSEQQAALKSDLTKLDAQVISIIGRLDKCQLVSGHDELGYFSENYGCVVIGAIIPNFSTTAEATAGELAALKTQISEHKVSAIFTGLGTSQDVADQLAKELGVRAVSLSTHFTNGAENYREFMLRLANQIASALK
ncbi:MAG: zinc ABC transporter substrate-binding protein [Acidimicrobiaceae bacterium]|nr:zinc ABC transporter substrate-binding protein [Acidimicrobiaceae bacterium]